MTTVRKSWKKSASAPELPVEWLQIRKEVRDAEAKQKNPASPSRILVVSGATRSEHTCPGEVALCHWPCSCYPNHAMGQTNDWMAELYPRWVAAHGVFPVCPVHWYQAPATP